MEIITIVVIITLILCCCLSLSGGYYFLQQNKEATPSQSSKKAEPSQSSNKVEPSQSSKKAEPEPPQTSYNPIEQKEKDNEKAATADKEAFLALIEKYKIPEGKLIAGKNTVLKDPLKYLILTGGLPWVEGNTDMDIDGKKISFNQAQIDLMRLYREFTLEGRNIYIFDLKYTLDFQPENNKSYLDIIKQDALDNKLKKATPESIAANEKDKASKPNQFDPLNPFDFIRLR